jgi:hypothetical protein
MRVQRQHKAKTKSGQGRLKPKTFAEWAQSPAPHQLGLEHDAVARIARAMARPEMRGISSLEGLVDGLKWLRVFYADDLAWKRFLLAARCLWLRYKGKIS